MDSQLNQPSSRRRTAAWVLITAGSQAWRVIMGLVSVVVLARLLTPADFGLIATASPIWNFVLLLQSLGFNQAIIQRRTVEESQMNALFWLAFTASVTLAGLFLLATPAVASFFDQPALRGLLNATSLLILVAALAAQPVALLNRRLQFRALAIIDAVGSTVGVLGAIIVAYYTSSYWALFVPTAAALTVSLVGATVVSGWRIGRPRFDKGVMEMVRFGAGMSIFNIANFLARNADKLLIAKAHGPELLGFYDRAYRLMLTPMVQATVPLTRVLTPVLSRLQDQPVHYRATYFDAVSSLMLLIQPPLLTAVIFSHAAVGILLGERWLDAAPIFMWLGIAGLQQVFTSTTGWLMISQGRMREFASLGVFGSMMAILSFVIGLPWGPLGVAVSYTLTDAIVRVPVSWYVVGRKGPVRLKDILGIVIPHALAIILSLGLLLVAHMLRPQPGLFELAGLVCCTYLIQAATLAAFPSKRDLFRRGLRMIKDRVNQG